MPTTGVEETLGEFFGSIALRNLVEKKVLGGYEVPLAPLIARVSFWMFQVGSVLGRTLRDRLPILVKMIPMTADEPNPEQKVCDVLCMLATNRLKRYGRNPSSLADFWLETEFRVNLADMSRESLKDLCTQKVPLDEILAERKLDEWLSWGIGFGAEYPQLLQDLWAKTFENVDGEAWTRARSHGVALPETPTALPLKDMETVVLADVAIYAQKYFAHLLEPLGLTVPQSLRARVSGTTSESPK